MLRMQSSNIVAMLISVHNSRYVCWRIQKVSGTAELEISLLDGSVVIRDLMSALIASLTLLLNRLLSQYTTCHAYQSALKKARMPYVSFGPPSSSSLAPC